MRSGRTLGVQIRGPGFWKLPDEPRRNPCETGSSALQGTQSLQYAPRAHVPGVAFPYFWDPDRSKGANFPLSKDPGEIDNGSTSSCSVLDDQINSRYLPLIASYSSAPDQIPSEHKSLTRNCNLFRLL